MAVLLLTTLLLLASCATPTSPGEHDARISAEWKLAQDRLECLGYAVSDIQPWHFGWVVKPDWFYCAGVKANGCYGSGLIKWNVKTPQVIRHEAGHAILDKLGEKYWYCYEHGAIAKDECPARLAYPEKSGC